MSAHSGLFGRVDVLLTVEVAVISRFKRALRSCDCRTVGFLHPSKTLVSDQVNGAFTFRSPIADAVADTVAVAGAVAVVGVPAGCGDLSFHRSRAALKFSQFVNDRRSASISSSRAEIIIDDT